jgi:hypothetical protein
LTGTTWDAAITLTNGDTESGSLSAHWRIDNVWISHNTLVNNVSNIEIGYANADNSWRKEPRNVTFANNLVLGADTDLIAVFTEPTDFVWHGNIMFPQQGAVLGITATAEEINRIDPLLERVDDLWLLSNRSPAIDAASPNDFALSEDMQGQPRVNNNDVGADEYATTEIFRGPLYPEDVGPDAFSTVPLIEDSH